MKPSRLATAIAFVATAALSAAAGWSARLPAADEAPPPIAAARVAIARSVSPEPAPLIEVSGDGNVTLRVERQPLEWVLEQIAAQSGGSDVRARARTAAAAPSRAQPPAALEVETTCAPSTLALVDATRVLQAIDHVSETNRYDALMQARSDGIVVPEATLKRLMDADPSERVRLAAFESLLESRFDARLLRETLLEAQYAPSAAIQQEARRRLEELQEMERIDAQLAQAAPS